MRAADTKCGGKIKKNKGPGAPDSREGGGRNPCGPSCSPWSTGSPDSAGSLPLSFLESLKQLEWENTAAHCLHPVSFSILIHLAWVLFPQHSQLLQSGNWIPWYGPHYVLLFYKMPHPIWNKRSVLNKYLLVDYSLRKLAKLLKVHTFLHYRGKHVKTGEMRLSFLIRKI